MEITLAEFMEVLCWRKKIAKTIVLGRVASMKCIYLSYLLKQLPFRTIFCLCHTLEETSHHSKVMLRYKKPLIIVLNTLLSEQRVMGWRVQSGQST